MVTKEPVALHDIDNVHAFVYACMKRSGARPRPEEVEDLHAEGVCLLYVMARNYKEHIDGYAVAGRFSGYAIAWLPKQIKEAWHRGRPEHLRSVNAEGKKEYIALEATASLDDLMERQVTFDEWKLRTPGDFVHPSKRRR